MAALATDHIGKLGNQNTMSNGAWNARLAATTTEMANYADTIEDNMVQKDFRGANKQAKDDMRAALPSAVETQIANWVRAAFGKGSTQLRSVIGSGTTELRNLQDDMVSQYLGKVVTGLTPLIGNGVDQERLDDAEALKAQWDAIYAASEQSSADKRMSEEERRAAKASLAGVMFETLLEVSLANMGNPDVLGNFFTPSLAGGPSISNPGGGGGGGGGNGGGQSDPSSSVDPGSSTSSQPDSSSESNSSTSSFPSSSTSSFPSSSSVPSSSSSMPSSSSSYPSSSSSFPSSSSSSTSSTSSGV